MGFDCFGGFGWFWFSKVLMHWVFGKVLTGQVGLPQMATPSNRSIQQQLDPAVLGLQRRFSHSKTTPYFLSGYINFFDFFWLVFPQKMTKTIFLKPGKLTKTPS